MASPEDMLAWRDVSCVLFFSEGQKECLRIVP